MLPRAKPKRGFSRRKQNKSKIPVRIGIKERPEEIDNRSSVGHFEADLIFNKGSMSANVLTAIDRKSRYALMIKNKSKQSVEVIEGLKKKALDYDIKSITFDNGSEFTQHHVLGVDTYFCDPGKPWQKGSVEHLNWMVRYRIPFETDPAEIDEDLLDAVAYDLNHMPRESLGFQTLCEVFRKGFQGEKNVCCIF